MKTRSLVVANPTGFHARPAREFVDTAVERFPDTAVTVVKGDKRIDGKSMIRMLALSARYRDTVELTVEGGDEDGALRVLGDFFESIHAE